MKKLYVGLAVVAVLAVAGVSYSVNSGAGTMATEPVVLEEIPDADLVALAQGVAMGPEDASVTIIEFGDYQCPGCGSFASLVKPQIEAEYVEPGRARFIFYDFPLIAIHPNAFLAARAARCAADQGLAWEYHTALFANQTRWAGATNPSGDFVDYAGEVGADEGAFEDCLESDLHADVVTANMMLGDRLGVSGTPTIMVNDGAGNTVRVPANNFTAISEVVNGMLGEAGEGAGTSGGDPGGGDGGQDG